MVVHIFGTVTYQIRNVKNFFQRRPVSGHVIEGNLLHSMSRTLYEEVRFDRSKVTSVDWESYPMATIADAPDRIDKVLINEPDSPPRGAGEETSAQTQPAIANAIFDATGVRMRRLPFTAERVKAALAAHR